MHPEDGLLNEGSVTTLFTKPKLGTHPDVKEGLGEIPFEYGIIEPVDDKQMPGRKVGRHETSRIHVAGIARAMGCVSAGETCQYSHRNLLIALWSWIAEVWTWIAEGGHHAVIPTPTRGDKLLLFSITSEEGGLRRACERSEALFTFTAPANAPFSPKVSNGWYVLLDSEELLDPAYGIRCLVCAFSWLPRNLLIHFIETYGEATPAGFVRWVVPTAHETQSALDGRSWHEDAEPFDDSVKLVTGAPFPFEATYIKSAVQVLEATRACRCD